MSMSLELRRTLMAGLVAMTALLTVPHAALAGQAAPDVPADLQVPEGNRLFLVGHAVGVQIYECNITASGTGWTLLAPRAELYGDNGKLIATHFAGPTWRANDGSWVGGQKEAGVIVDRTAIPWLKLSATSKGVGPDGDRLALTTFVQRLNTEGGLAPAASQCDPTSVGTQAEVPYTADYYFWR
jgi:hypothetical protein